MHCESVSACKVTSGNMNIMVGKNIKKIENIDDGPTLEKWENVKKKFGKNLKTYVVGE